MKEMENGEKDDELFRRPRKMHNFMEFCSNASKIDRKMRNYFGPENPDELKRPSQIVTLPPSEYMRQLSMTTEERIELLTKDIHSIYTREHFVKHQNFQNFEIVPNKLIFQRYTSGNIYNVPLTIRNIGKSMHYLKLTSEIDPCFSIDYKGITASSNNRIAPGMYITYNVNFTPEESCDYEYTIKFTTDEEILTIPIIAIGPRAILDFPDLISIPETAVKICSSKSLLVRNLGDSAAIFNIFTSSPHFSIEPSKGIIEEEETVQFVLNFLSNQTGFFEDNIYLRYESGEVVRIQARCSAIVCNVRLERGSVKMQDEIYIGLSTSKSLKIFNRSDYIVKYRWMRYKNDETDEAQKKKYKKILESINNMEKKRCMDLVHYNICTPQAHEIICQRIYADEISFLVKEKFLFNNRHFSIIPMEGEIWPQSSVDATIIFEPDEIGELSAMAYLEADGREDRISLSQIFRIKMNDYLISLSGVSIGPLLKLNVATIDTGNIFLCSIHHYEVICVNKGLIPGTLVHRSMPSDFGGKIEVTPKHLKLRSGELDSFNVSFSTNRNGDFVERVEFVVKESLQIVSMYIKGRVICPSLYFDKTELDFGTMALGFTSTRDVNLHNDSLVPVRFSISVPEDGNEPVVTHQDFVESTTKPSFPSSPKEFVVTPREGLVQAQSSLKIQIIFTPNLTRVGKMTLRVDMWETESVAVLLPIIYRSIVASMIVKPVEIAIRFCYINIPYTRNIMIENSSEVEGYFHLVPPQPISESTTMIYSVSVNQGYLAPGQTINISLTVITRAMGKQKCILSMLTFGEKGPNPCCSITCNGQGPVVAVHPAALDFSKVDLLQEKTLTLNLTNDSPVPTQFEASLSSKNSSWKLSPTCGDLNPDQSIDLRVTIYLRDIGKHSNKIIIEIPNNRTIVVALNAIGIGSCLQYNPQIFPTFEIGSLFRSKNFVYSSHQDTSIPIELTNQGSRLLKLIFYNSPEIKMQGGQLLAPMCDKFLIDPFVFEVSARSTKTVFCKHVVSDLCGPVLEEWWLHCYVDGQGKREIIGNGTFSATFVEPSISFSKEELLFRLDMLRNEKKESLSIEEFFAVNRSGLDLNARLSIDPPFGILSDNDDRLQRVKIVLPKQAESRVRLFFYPQQEHREKRYSVNFLGYLKLEYEEHPKCDKIKCFGSVNFPNIASLPKEIRFNCPLACSALKNVFLKNTGPFDVSYKFVWVEESISMKRNESNESEANEEASIESYREEGTSRFDFLAQTKNVLLSILTDGCFPEETETCVLQNLSTLPPLIDSINQICSIVPSQGVVPANSSICVSFAFHSNETIDLRATAVCDIAGGPKESIRIVGAADLVKFRLDKDRIDFGEQMIRGRCRAALNLENLSKIDIYYEIELTEEENEFLEISPKSMTIPSQSKIVIEIFSRPLSPGFYSKSFLLCIRYENPLLVMIEGTAVISQVYVSLPRKNIFDEHPVELGYRAVQSLAHSYDHTHVNEDGWEIVANDHTLPNKMDIEMAIERSIAKEYLQKSNIFKDLRDSTTREDSAIPNLFSPEYVLDLGYVIVGQTSNASTRVYNCGSRSARIRLKKSDLFSKQGIDIYFRNQNALMPGEFIDLQVSVNHPKFKTSEKSVSIKRTFYLEVINGFTVPITIVATVTLPFISSYPEILNFKDVLIGECMLTHLRIKNEGLIDCPWEAKLPPTRRNQSEGPFYLHNNYDIYSPGQSGTMKVYFQPRKSGYVESQLTIRTHPGLEASIVLLRGRAIEHKIKISQTFVHFDPLLPYSRPKGHTFTVENIGQRSVELYWQHLDKLVSQEDRLIRVLTHYYQVEEIMLPAQSPPATLPQHLFDFYDSLLDQMNVGLATQRQSIEYYIKNEETTEPEDHSANDKKIVALEEASMISRLSKRSKSRKILKKLPNTRSSTVASSEPNLSTVISSEFDIFQASHPQNDPDEIENLLHSFIDELQKQPDFHDNMKDPVKEVFDSIQKSKSQPEQTELSSLPRRAKICIIFHGPAFSEYQQTACKISRVLGIPLLNLNTTMTEMIALGNTACSAKLREIIDSKYRQLLTSYEKSGDEKHILTIEDLNAVDSLSRYEYKIETLDKKHEKIGNLTTPRETPRGGKTSSTRDSEKSSRTTRSKAQETFLEIDSQMLEEILGQRLSMEDFSEGFVLQSLKNRFIPNEIKSLIALLQYFGEVEYPIFVTFNDSFDSYVSEHSVRSNDQAKLEDEMLKRLTSIDEMSLSEFDNLSDTEKEFYREKIIRVRSKEAQNKQTQLQEHLSEMRRDKYSKRRQSKTQRSNKGLKNATKSKTRINTKLEQTNERTMTPELAKNKNENIENSKSIGKHPQNIIDEIEAYSTSLQSILSILQNWNPSQKITDTKTSKAPKNTKVREIPQTTKEKPVDATQKFWTWYVRSNNPQISEAIISEIGKIKKTFDTKTPKFVAKDSQDLRSEMYSVALPKKPLPRRLEKAIQQDEVFDLVALKSQTLDSSSESLEIDGPGSSNISEEILEPRIVLRPHETRTFKINFSPKSPEFFETVYALGILNSRQPFYSIKANGSGVIPRIDMTPSRIFKKVKRFKKNELGDPAFFEDTQTFDFGCLLWTGKDDRVHRKKASFKFWNDTKIDLELEASLMTNEPKIFDIKPKQLFIKAEEFGTIDVTAGVTKLGTNEDRLFILVKNNPRVEAIELRSNGTKLDVQVEGKNLTFGRALMYRATSKIFKIRNNSTIPIFWKIIPLVPIDDRIKFAPSIGWTKARTETDVIFTFLANQVGIMEKITLNFGVFLHEMDELKEALFTETITVTGETYDVAVDVNFANPIDMGVVKVDSIASRSFELKNRGQYDVKFVIEFEEGTKSRNELSREVRKNVIEDFRVSLTTGNLVPAKTTTIDVTFNVKVEMDLLKFPILRCNLIDANNGATIIAEFPLTLSITSHYARFQLIPDSEINFGPIAIFEKKTLQFNVENTGNFALTYRIKNARSVDTSVDNLGVKQREKSPRSESTKRGTGKSHDRSSHLRLGPFTLSDIEGKIEMSQVKTMTIECYPEVEGSLDEKMIVFVDNCLPEDRSGKSLVLKVTSCIPAIDFGDLDSIFAESYLVDDIQDFRSPNEIDTYTIFSRNEKCLYFERVNIHKPYTTSVKLHNRGLVPARVTVFLRPDVLTPKNAKPDTFAIDTVQETIAPMSSRIFSISFTPSLIETYTGVLEAVVELPDQFKNDSNKLSIKLCGESCVPEVIMTEPALDKRTGKSKIHFGRCLIDEKTSRSLSFKNVGKISAKIIVGIRDDDEMIYSVRNSENIANEIEIFGDSEENHRGIIRALRPDETAQLLVDFRPKSIGPKKAQVQFHVIDNPYENLTLEIEGEGFMENVVFENLPIVEIPKSEISNGTNKSKKSLKNRGSVSRAGSVVTLGSQMFTSPSLVYNLDYKSCFVNKMSKISFAIVNKSGEQFFRFEFSSHPNIVFVPSVGHLQRLEKKEVTAHFLTTEPITYKETALECVINEIRFTMHPRDTNSWDDRRTTVEWLEVDNDEEEIEEISEEITKQKVVVPTREPSHEILPGSWRTIQLIFSAIAAYSEFACDIEEIHFTDTLMFQNREYTFTMENPGNVELRFQWKVDMDAGYPARLPEMSTRPPSLRPRSRRSYDSRPSSRSSGGILYPENKNTHLEENSSRHQRGDELFSIKDTNRCGPIESRDKSYVIDVEPYDSGSRTHDLFSDSFARTQRSIESWTENGDDQPFSIKPEIASVPARESIKFTVRFSPLDVFDYKAFLICQIENLNPDIERPRILVTGRSLLPYCHFDIEESDYLTSGRRDQNLSNDLQQFGGGDSKEFENFSNPRVVEFRAIGTGQSYVKEFDLINPTTENYRFSWKDLTVRESEQLPYFHCAREEDLAESGKRSKIKFSFFAEEIGTYEAFWRFSIDRYNLQTIFLIVANITEPSVRFSETRLKMKPTIVGMRVDDVLTIVNDEKSTFSWKFLANSLHSEEGAFQKLLVSPMSGILGAGTRQVVQISLLPNCIGEFTFPLQCQFKGMKNPLSILVTARVSRISPRVIYSFVNREEDIFEARSDRENVLDFGKLSLNKPSAIKFEISNTTDVTFHYTWSLDNADQKYTDLKNRAYFLTISKESDHVSNVYASTCQLELMALKKTIVRHHPVTLKIDNGPIYRMLVKASSKTPSIEFNFYQFDFGPCYMRNENSPAYQTQLLITNHDRTGAIVECSFENVPHLMLDLRSLSQAIPANSIATIPVHFRPTELKNYHETLIFSINDSITQEISVKGEGIFYKISLEDIRDKFIEFGNVPVGKTMTRKIRVKNSGRAPVDVKFDLIKKLSANNDNPVEKLSHQDPVIDSKAKRLSSRFKEFREGAITSEKKEDSITEMLSIEPVQRVSLAAGKSIEIIIKFVATKRMNNFIEKIGGEVDSTILPLFFVRGNSVARLFRLNQNNFYFGTIVDGCSKIFKLVLHNDGDFGAKFKWNISQLSPHFSLEPVSGYCSSGMDITFDLIFQPKKLSQILEAEASIEIEKHASLKIRCSGACCKIPKPIDVIKFLVSVRSNQTKNLTITNDTDVVWSVETIVNGEYFEAEKSFLVSPKSSYDCTLIYSPLVMNTNKSPHEGRIIVKLPEEKSPLVYTLHGLSLPPQAKAKISRQLPAKTKYVELLPVKNWLNESQSFHCVIKLIRDPKIEAVHYSFTGNLRMDLPANGTRDYRAIFHCYKETILNFHVTFTNDNGEYEFYEIQYKVTKPDILSTIKLKTPARTTTSYCLGIENPLDDRSVSFTATSQNRDVTIRNVPKVVAAKSNDKIIIEYSPLVPGESVAKLDVNSSELGNFPYELKLKATAAPAEKTIRVTAMLGSSMIFPITINNISKKNAEFNITVDDLSFTCNQNISISPQKNVILEVTYEPCDARNVNTTLRATSESLGEICFPLIGSYTLPKPQGPFTISRNSTIDILFKNVSDKTKTFTRVIEGSDKFTIATSSSIIKPKETATITVKFNGPVDFSEEERKYPTTGKLVVSSVEPFSSPISWVYYLRGTE